MSDDMDFMFDETDSDDDQNLALAGFQAAIKRAHDEVHPETPPAPKRSKSTEKPYRRRTPRSDPATEKAIRIALEHEKRPKFKRKRVPTSKAQHNADMRLSKTDLVNRLNHYRKIALAFALE